MVLWRLKIKTNTDLIVFNFFGLAFFPVRNFFFFETKKLLTIIVVVFLFALKFSKIKNYFTALFLIPFSTKLQMEGTIHVLEGPPIFNENSLDLSWISNVLRLDSSFR